MAVQKILYDCDPGHDDAVALMLAAGSPELELLGVTIVAGNQTLDNTGRNACHVLQWLGREEIPVYTGCERPMVRDRVTAGDIHGETGLDGPVFPPLRKRPEPEHAVRFLVRTLMSSQGDVTVVTSGPMTNLAMALRMEPAAAEKIRRIVLMGGSYTNGNVTPAAEFNILADPEAAQIVLTSGVKTITMVPLDATHQANFTREDEAELRQIGTPLAIAVADLVDERIVAYNAYQPQDLPDSAPIHDALCVAYLLDPEVLTDVRHMRVDVDISGGFADGQTICDTRAYPDRPENCYVALGADRLRFSRMVLDMIRDFR